MHYIDPIGKPLPKPVNVSEHNKLMRRRDAMALSGEESPYTVRLNSLLQTVVELERALEGDDLTDKEIEWTATLIREQRDLLAKMPRANSEAERKYLEATWKPKRQ